MKINTTDNLSGILETVTSVSSRPDFTPDDFDAVIYAIDALASFAPTTLSERVELATVTARVITSLLKLADRDAIETSLAIFYATKHLPMHGTSPKMLAKAISPFDRGMQRDILTSFFENGGMHKFQSVDAEGLADSKEADLAIADFVSVMAIAFEADDGDNAFAKGLMGSLMVTPYGEVATYGTKVLHSIVRETGNSVDVIDGVLEGMSSRYTFNDNLLECITRSILDGIYSSSSEPLTCSPSSATDILEIVGVTQCKDSFKQLIKDRLPIPAEALLNSYSRFKYLVSRESFPDHFNTSTFEHNINHTSSFIAFCIDYSVLISREDPIDRATALKVAELLADYDDMQPSIITYGKRERSNIKKIISIVNDVFLAKDDETLEEFFDHLQLEDHPRILEIAKTVMPQNSAVRKAAINNEFTI